MIIRLSVRDVLLKSLVTCDRKMGYTVNKTVSGRMPAHP